MAPPKRSGKTENKLRRFLAGTLPDHCVALSWQSNGQMLAAASVSGPVMIYDSASGKPVAELAGHGFGTTAIGFQPGTTTLASTGQDGKARLWETTTGKELAVLAGGAGWVDHLAWSASGILATSAGKKVRLWDAAGQQLREYADHGSTVADLAWRPGSNLLAVAAYGGVTLYDPQQDVAVRKFEWKGSPLKLAWSTNGQLLAHGNQDSSVHLWYAETGKDLEMPGYPTKVRELSWDVSGRFLATGGGPAIILWDCGGKGPEGSKPQILVEGDDDSPLAALEWQKRGYLLAAAGRDGRVHLWQPANKKAPLIGQDALNVEASAIAWSPDDRLLAVGAATGAVVVYRIG